MESRTNFYSIKLDKIRAISAPDGILGGNAEPYLWAILIRIGGNEIRQNPNNLAQFLGTPHYEFSQGSHDNLRLSGFGIDTGQEKDIPPEVGNFNGFIQPIVVNYLGFEFEVPSVLALITVLMEEDNVTDVGAETGHQALNQLVETKVNQFIANLNLDEIIPAAINVAIAEDINIEQAAIEVLGKRFEKLEKELVDDGQSIIKDAIQNDQSIFENLWTWINADDYVGADMTLFTIDASIEKNKAIPLRKRYNEESGDYEVSGTIYVTPPLIPEGRLPIIPRLEIQKVSKKFSRRHKVNYITYVGGEHDGEPWLLHKHKAAQLVLNRIKSFYVKAPDGSETEILVNRHEDTGSLYLRTRANETTEDNLLSLPELSFYYLE